MMVLEKFLYRHEAELVKAMLKDEGIEAMVSADDCGYYRPALPFGSGGAGLLVRKDDFEKAKDFLKKNQLQRRRHCRSDIKKIF